MKKLATIFLILSSAVTAMDREELSLETFADGWKVINISQKLPAIFSSGLNISVSQKRPISDDCIKVVLASIAQTDNNNQNTKKDSPMILHMDFCLPTQFRQDNLIDGLVLKRCNFLVAWKNPVFPKEEGKPFFFTVRKGGTTQIFEVYDRTATSVVIDIPDDGGQLGSVASSEIKSTLDRNKFVFLRNNSQQTSTIPEPMSTKKPVATYSMAAKLTVGLAFAASALLALYQMDYLPDNISQFLTEWRQSILIFGFPPA